MSGRVIIIMGSGSDREHAERIRKPLVDWGVPVEVRVASAHKSAAHLLAILSSYEAQGGSRVYIAIAGRSNALGGLVDASVTAPVITCPPYSDAFAGADVFSSLRMPGGVAPLLVLDPANAALAAAKILSLGDEALAEVVRQQHSAAEERILADDQSLQKG
ncbi:MAG: AIR carboxylase family protein [Anaerolineae bacterium]|nr:AIR carboxylase family protein [Anaerolineae bacterium]